MLTQRYPIDMVPGGVPLTLHVTQYDVGMTEFVFELFASSGDLDLSTVVAAKIEATKPDGLAVINDCTYANGEVTYVLQEQLTAKAGQAWSKLVLLDEDSNVTASKAILWKIDKAGVTDNAIVSESDLPVLREAIEAGAAAVRAAEEAQETLDEFAPIVAHQVEQMQIHEGQTVIDGTLTVSGAAADAKATGDRIKAAKDDIHEAKAPVIVNSASGSIATFADGADDMIMRSLAVNIAPLQSGTGDPSPTNVRPISGWTAVNVTRAGKNLLPTTVFSSATKQGLTYTYNADGTMTVNGTASTNSYQESSELVYPFDVIVNGVPVNASGTALDYNVYIQVYSSVTGVGGSVHDNNETMIIPANAPFRIRLRIGNGLTVSNAVFTPMVRPTMISDYLFEPYLGTTYPVTLPSSAGTVYGGTLDVVKGTLTVTKKGVDLGSVTWSRGAGTGGAVYVFTHSFADKAYGVTNLICDRLMTTSVTSWGTSKPNNSICGSATSTTVVIRYDDATTEAELQTALTGSMMVYDLATPLTYTLTPTEIRTLLGNNVVYADAGAVDVQYPADTKLYIDGKIAELQALVLENA